MMLLQDKHRFSTLSLANYGYPAHARSETALFIMHVHAWDIHLLVRSCLAVIGIFLCLFSVFLSSLQ